MYDFLISNPVVAIVFAILFLVITILLCIKIARDAGLEKIRAVVYDGFVKAENKFKHGDNEQKFEHVVQLARSALPEPWDLLITEKLLRKTIQLWFDICKDLLDDGRVNGTGKK